MASNTEFGLGAYFYSRDIGRVWRVAETLECGRVWINIRMISNEVASFGGMTRSGIGSEGSYYEIDDRLAVMVLAILAP